MPRYSAKRKRMIFSKMMPPLNMTIAGIARTEGIVEIIIYNCRDSARDIGYPVPGKKSTRPLVVTRSKLAVGIEAGSMNETELSLHCPPKQFRSGDLLLA